MTTGNGLTLAAVEMTDLSELGVASAVYGQVDRALQPVWPDPEGRMPWPPAARPRPPNNRSTDPAPAEPGSVRRVPKDHPVVNRPGPAAA